MIGKVYLYSNEGNSIIRIDEGEKQNPFLF